MTDTATIKPVKNGEPAGIRDRYREQAVAWSEDIKYDGGLLVLSAASFKAWTDAFAATLGLDIPRLRSTDNLANRAKRVGELLIYLRRLRFGEVAQQYVCGFPCGKPRWTKNKLPMARPYQPLGEATFDDDVDILVVTTVDRRSSDGPWMSMTPQEAFSQRPGLRKARGHVLVGGMGLGWFARRCLERSKVKSVTVVDVSRNMLDLFGGPLKKDFGDRVKFVRADAFDHANKNLQKYDSILFDIWDRFGNATGDDRWEAIQAAHPNAWAWGYTRRDI